MKEIFEFLKQNEILLWWLGAASIVMFVGSLIALPYLVSLIPEDYFVRDRPPRDSFSRQHPVVRIAGLILKNLMGVVLIVAGIAMLVLPGQGILTIVAGLMLMDFPGKRALEIWMIRKHSISRAINWMRARHHKPPLQVPFPPSA